MQNKYTTILGRENIKQKIHKCRFCSKLKKLDKIFREKKKILYLSIEPYTGEHYDCGSLVCI